MKTREAAVTYRYKDEILTDNTKIRYCDICEDCLLWGHGDAYSNAYNKSSCDMYPYPAMKPIEVINNKGTCLYRKTR